MKGPLAPKESCTGLLHHLVRHLTRHSTNRNIGWVFGGNKNQLIAQMPRTAEVYTLAH